MSRTMLASIAALASAAGCMSAPQHRADVQDDSTARLTVGTVQREIRVGLTGTEVIEVLGAPNVVATDTERNETWVYDKVATETVYSSSSGGVAALILGGGGDTAGAGVGNVSTLGGRHGPHTADPYDRHPVRRGRTGSRLRVPRVAVLSGES